MASAYTLGWTRPVRRAEGLLQGGGDSRRGRGSGASSAVQRAHSNSRTSNLACSPLDPLNIFPSLPTRRGKHQLCSRNGRKPPTNQLGGILTIFQGLGKCNKTGVEVEAGLEVE